MTTTPSPTSTSPPRPSKFTEGQPLTRPDYLSQTATSNQLFFTILNEMDEFERKRQANQPHSSLQTNSQTHPQPHTQHHRHRNLSASSNTSCPSPTGTHSFGSSYGGNGNESTNENNREEARLTEMGMVNQQNHRHYYNNPPPHTWNGRGSMEHVYGRKSLDVGGGPRRRRRESTGGHGHEHEISMQEGLEKVGKLGQKFKGRLRALTGGSSGGGSNGGGGGRDEFRGVPYPGT